MIIPINEKYRIESGPRSWDVQKWQWGKNRQSGEFEDQWPPKTYHRTLREAVRAAYRRLLREVGGTKGVDTQAQEDAIHALFKDIQHNLDISAIDVEQLEIDERRAE